MDGTRAVAEMALQELLRSPLADFGLRPQTLEALERHGLQAVADFVAAAAEPQGLAGLSGLDPKAVREVAGLHKVLAGREDVRERMEPLVAAELEERPVEDLDLGNRARGVLQRNGIASVAELLRLSRGSEGLRRLRGAGTMVVGELRDRLLQVLAGDPAAYRPPESIEIATALAPTGRPDLLELLPRLACTVLAGAVRDLDVIRRRFGLLDGSSNTLEDIGLYHGVTRERIRQNEARALGNLRDYLSGAGSGPWHLADDVVAEYRDLVQSFEAPRLLTEADLLQELGSRYGTRLPHPPLLLLELMHLKKVNWPGNAAERFGACWRTASFPAARVDALAEAERHLREILRREVRPLPLFDLVVGLRRQKTGSKMDRELVEGALAMSGDVEALEDGRYQLVFRHLASLADLAFRVLSESPAEPVHSGELIKEVNRRLVSAGAEPGSHRSMTSQLSQDDRFVPVGRSGKWALAEWEGVYADTIRTAMLEFFHSRGQRATITEILESVRERRPGASRGSIYMNLGVGSDFVRVSDTEYELRSWGTREYRETRAPVLNAEEVLVEAIRDYFGRAGTDRCGLAELRREMQKRTGAGETTIYNYLERLPFIRLEPDPRFPQRRVAVYLPDAEYRPSVRTPTLKARVIEDAVRMEDGQFYGYLDWDAHELTARLRDSVLASFTRLGLLEEDTARTMLAWPVERSGFHVHVESAIPEGAREQLRTVLRYLTRAPVSLERLSYDEATGAVGYRTRKGADLRWAHAVDFLADLSQHIPPPRRQTVSYHGHFANALGRLEKRRQPAPEEPASPERSRRTRWARLILRTWRSDPELCPSCGKVMTRTRAIMERAELVRLLAHLRLGGHPPRPPPAPVPSTAPVTYGAVGRRGGAPRPPLVPAAPATPAPAEPEVEDSQVPPGWEDWDPA